MADNLMKALVMNGPNIYDIERVPIPKPEYGEVLIRVKSVAICGSDPKLLSGMSLPQYPPAYPFIAGHEFSGEIVELGPGVKSFKIGDRVAGEGHFGCGYCENCRTGFYNLCLNYGKSEKGHRHYGFNNQGAYAEYAAYNSGALTLLPDNVSFNEAAMLDTATTAFNGVKLIGIVPGGTSVIIGDGPIGIFAMQFAKAMGSKAIVVGTGKRLEMAKKLGADIIIDFMDSDAAEEVSKVTNGRRGDRVFECVGTDQTIRQSILCAKRGGKIVLIGMPIKDTAEIPVKNVIMDQLTVVGSRSSSNCFQTVIEMFSSGMIDAKSMISHVFPIEEMKTAVDIFANKKDGSIKVIINP